MSYYICTTLLILSFVIYNECLTPSSSEKTFEKGVKAYSDERWSKCIEKFEESLHLYKLYKSVVVNCRLKCNSRVYDSLVKENIEDLKIYETYFNKKNCVDRCQKNGFIGVNLDSNLDEYIFHKMNAKKPYEYLHICYFQMHMFQKAASAAYTYLVAHPDDETMISNMKYYIRQPEIDANEVIDLESDDYLLLYDLGKQSYSRDNWAETVANMEEALNTYIASENVCRVECEQQPGQEWSSEFVITMSNNMASLLHCRQLCQDKLKLLKYNSGIEFLADVLNYLQMSYFQLEKFQDAYEAVTSSLVLIPKDKDMIANEKFYKKLIDKEISTQRPDIEFYMKRDKYEKDLLHLFHQANKNNINSNSS